MKKLLMTGLLMFASRWLKKLSPYSHASFDLTKLKLAMGYLQSIKTLRMLFISFLGVGVSLIFLFAGVIIFHLAVIFLVPWSVETKVMVTLGCAALYVCASAGVFAYVFSEDKWLRIFNADKMIRELSGNQEVEDETNKEEKTEFVRRSSL